MPGTLDVGDAAPEFSLPRAGAEPPLTLGAFAGTKLVIYFYPKDDTSGCTKEAIAFSGLRGAFKEAGTAVLGVSPDSLASHGKFAAKYNLDLELGADEDKRMLEAFGVWAEKSMYGRRYMGVERTTFLLDRQGRISRIWRNVKVPGHAEEVLAAAQALP